MGAELSVQAAHEAGQAPTAAELAVVADQSNTPSRSRPAESETPPAGADRELGVNSRKEILPTSPKNNPHLGKRSASRVPCELPFST